MNHSNRAEYNRRLVKKWKENGLCVRCGGNLDDQYITCSACRKKLNLAKTNMERRRDDKGLCRKCGKPTDAGYRTCTACTKKMFEYTGRPQYIQKRKERYRELKNEVFMAYGGYICKCCGETEPLFLCLDHMEGNGNRHRAEIGVSGRGRNIYTWLKKNKFPEGFQVLCHNCNNGKHLNGGVCPHKKRGTSGRASGRAAQ